MSKEKKIVPELRFPEFDGDGEWVEKILGESCDMQAAKFVNKALQNINQQLA